MAKKKQPLDAVTEIAVIGEVDDWESDVAKELLGVTAGGECFFFIDSAGGL